MKLRNFSTSFLIICGVGVKKSAKTGFQPGVGPKSPIPWGNEILDKPFNSIQIERFHFASSSKEARDLRNEGCAAGSNNRSVSRGASIGLPSCPLSRRGLVLKTRSPRKPVSKSKSPSVGQGSAHSPERSTFFFDSGQAALTSERTFSGFFISTQATAVPSIANSASPSRSRTLALPRIKWRSKP